MKSLNRLSPLASSHIYEAFGKHTVRSKGIDGLAQEPVSFEIRKNETLVGCVVV